MSQSWEQSLIETVLLAQVQEQKRRRRWTVFFRLMGFAVFFWMIFHYYYPSTSGYLAQSHTALVELSGEISADAEANADAIVGGLRQAFEQPNAKGVIIRINSPGGSPVQSGYIYDEIMRLRALYPNKKIYAVISDIGASGAYYVAAAAHEIYADKASIVGSIGVIMVNMGVVDLLKKIGVEQRTLTAGQHKALLDPMSPVKADERAFMQTLLDTTHRQFIAAVQKGRGNRLKSTPEIFSGLFWTGEQALSLGLVDGLGSAGFVARDLIGAEDIYDYSVSPNWLDRVSHRLGMLVQQQIQALTLAPVKLQ